MSFFLSTFVPSPFSLRIALGEYVVRFSLPGSVFLPFDHRLDFLYQLMYRNTYSKSMDQPGKVANPARGQLNRENG